MYCWKCHFEIYFMDCYGCEIALNWKTHYLSYDKSTSVWVMAWCYRTTSLSEILLTNFYHKIKGLHKSNIVVTFVFNNQASKNELLRVRTFMLTDDVSCTIMRQWMRSGKCVYHSLHMGSVLIYPIIVACAPSTSIFGHIVEIYPIQII